jgi:hypothetical protein
MSEKRIIEINGTKFEVDTSNLQVIENYRIGDRIKVLLKEYGDSYKPCPGVIVGFEPFEKHPTIVIAYLKTGGYGDKSPLKILFFNSETENVEICQMVGKELPFEKANVLELMDREILKTEQEVIDLKRRREYFLTEFGKYFEHAEVVDEAGTDVHVF